MCKKGCVLFAIFVATHSFSTNKTSKYFSLQELNCNCKQIIYLLWLPSYLHYWKTLCQRSIESSHQEVDQAHLDPHSLCRCVCFCQVIYYSFAGLNRREREKSYLSRINPHAFYSVITIIMMIMIGTTYTEEEKKWTTDIFTHSAQRAGWAEANFELFRAYECRKRRTKPTLSWGGLKVSFRRRILNIFHGLLTTFIEGYPLLFPVKQENWLDQARLLCCCLAQKFFFVRKISNRFTQPPMNAHT